MTSDFKRPQYGVASRRALVSKLNPSETRCLTTAALQLNTIKRWSLLSAPSSRNSRNSRFYRGRLCCGPEIVL